MSFSCTDLITSYDVNTPPRTNLEAWINYCQYVESPNSYIVFGYYTAIAAALQRRVFKQHNTVRLYPNMFTVLVGDASTGKGRVIKPLKGILKSFDNDYSIVALDINGNEQQMAGFVKPSSKEDDNDQDRSGDIAATMEQMSEKVKLSDELLFPIPADSSSLRAVSSYMAQSQRTIYYTEELTDGTKKKRAYIHSSAFFMLEEIVSLFKDKKETKDMVDFLVQTWDSGDYRHATVGYGIDNILNSCVSLLAGTTPDSMEDLFGSRLLKEGLSSRTLFVFETGKRFRHFCTEDVLKPSQIDAYKRLKRWFKRLSMVYGPVEFSRESIEYLREWYEVNFEESIVNKNTRLEYYYGRKDMHIMKMAMAIHFSEKLDRRVSLDDVKMAHALLDSIEPNMHMALRVSGRNELSSVTRKILGMISKHGPIHVNALWMEFNDDLKSIAELKEVLMGLRELGKVAVNPQGKYITGNGTPQPSDKKAEMIDHINNLAARQGVTLKQQITT